MSADGWLDFTVQPLDGDVCGDLERYWNVWLPRRPALLFLMFHSYTVRGNYTRRLECASPICGHHSPGEPSCYLTCWWFEPCEVPVQEEYLAVTSGVQPSELIKQYWLVVFYKRCDFNNFDFSLLSFFSLFLKRPFYCMQLEHRGFRSGISLIHLEKLQPEAFPEYLPFRVTNQRAFSWSVHAALKNHRRRPWGRRSGCSLHIMAAVEEISVKFS